MSGFGVQIQGLERVIRKLSPELIASPMRDFWSRVAIAVQSLGRQYAPVDTGRLRNSIAYEIDQALIPLWAKIGSNVVYAAAQEYGTGVYGDGGYRAGPSTGGIRPKRYLRGAIEDSVDNIRGYLDRLGQDIKARWEARG